MRFLALGDSYTIGEGVPPDQRWPLQLAGLLQSRGLARLDTQIIARTGWTTAELVAAVRAADPRGPFDLVSLLIGVNNQYRGLPLEQYQLEFKQLLDQAQDFAGGQPGRVLVLSIPDWGCTPFAAGRDRARVAEEIDCFNAVNALETAEAGARYIEITALTRRLADEPTWLAADGLHPSGAQYDQWAELCIPAALAALAL